MAIPKVWSLSTRIRLGIALFAAAYLVATHPWAQGDRSIAQDHYQLALAFLMMAAMPRGTKLYIALGVTLGVLVLAGVAFNALSMA